MHISIPAGRGKHIGRRGRTSAPLNRNSRGSECRTESLSKWRRILMRRFFAAAGALVQSCRIQLPQQLCAYPSHRGWGGDSPARHRLARWRDAGIQPQFPPGTGRGCAQGTRRSARVKKLVQARGGGGIGRVCRAQPEGGSEGKGSARGFDCARDGIPDSHFQDEPLNEPVTLENFLAACEHIGPS